MSARPHLIAKAAEYLTKEKGTPREKLVFGAKLLWIATTFADGWTPKMLTRAKGVCRGLAKDGITEREMKWMKDETVKNCLKELTKEVVELAAEIERGRRQG
jgi:hypothetical protein